MKVKTVFKGNYIDGAFRAPRGRVRTRLSEDPGDLDHPVGRFAFSDDDVDQAVASAQAGFAVWKKTPFAVRARAVSRFQKALKEQKNAFALLMTREMGKPLRDSVQEAGRMIERVTLARQEAARLSRGESFPDRRGFKAVLRHRPRGILGIIGPFNFPGHIPNTQILSALLLGNSVVFKPSEYTPFVGQLLAELWHAAGLPKGVFNLIQGDGQVGRALAVHEKIHGIIFTGSYATGQKIREQTLHQIGKLVALEMGGKNAAIVSRHADLPSAAEACLLGAFSVSGQRCNATSRILLEKRIALPFLERFMPAVREVKVGYGLEEGVFLGPLVSRPAEEKYLSRTALATKEGFEVLRPPAALRLKKRGYYVQPSVCLKEVKEGHLPQGPYANEEIFGPNAAIYIVKDLAEAVRVHNAAPYGLVAAFFSEKRKEYETVLRELDVGLLNWNRATIFSSPRLPFGGLKQSGNHHPVGAFVPYLCTYPMALLEGRPAARGKR